MTETCLLTMDLQNGIAGAYGDDDYLARVATAQSAARSAGIEVVHVVVRFRAGHPEVNARTNKMFAAIASAGGMVEGEHSAGICPSVAPVGQEVVVAKRRVSAFAGSDLDAVLRAQQARHLVLAGVATSGVVLSTLRQAADLDYGLSVLSDASLDPDEEVHRVLTEKVFPRQADVHTVDEWAESLG